MRKTLKKIGYLFIYFSQIDFKFLLQVKKKKKKPWKLELRLDLFGKDIPDPKQGSPQRNGLGPASKYIERIDMF